MIASTFVRPPRKTSTAPDKQRRKFLLGQRYPRAVEPSETRRRLSIVTVCSLEFRQTLLTNGVDEPVKVFRSLK